MTSFTRGLHLSCSVGPGFNRSFGGMDVSLEILCTIQQCRNFDIDREYHDFQRAYCTGVRGSTGNGNAVSANFGVGRGTGMRFNGIWFQSRIVLVLNQIFGILYRDRIMASMVLLLSDAHQLLSAIARKLRDR